MRPPRFEARFEQSAGVERLRGFIESAAAETSRMHGVPLLPNGRIDMSAFRSVRRDVSADEDSVKQLQIEWYGDISQEEIERERAKTDGEKLEMLAYAIFYKNLAERFIVARSSIYDDINNKIDVILVNKETGETICAFDEVSDTSAGVDYEKKKQAVLERNKEHQGANIKYGIRLEKTGDKAGFVLGETEKVPIFYIALPKDKIERGMANFMSSPSEQSEFEKKLFQYFIASIDA